MEIAIRGQVQVAAHIDNLGDLINVNRGFFKSTFVKSIEVPDALIAPGTSCFALPARYVKELKLARLGTRKARTESGFAFFGIYEPVRLTVRERDCTVDVIKVPDGCPVLIGRVPMLLLDLTLDSAGQAIAGNPDHDGHPMVDLF